MNIEGKSSIHTVNTNVSGIELFNLAGIDKLHYKTFRLTVGSKEIQPNDNPTQVF